MKTSAKLKKSLALLYRYTIIAMICWAIIVAGSLGWNIYNERQSIRTMAKNEAISAFKRDEAFRLFIASRGGVYVPLDERTPSNPYLKHPERDITATSGKKYTLMNGAYLFRKVMEEFGTVTGVNWRLASLKPTNSANEPDAWERRALLAFQQGAKEMIEFNEIKGELHVRSLSPLVTKESCLKCHAYQGYKLGEIRGAMGVSLPMAPYLQEERRSVNQLILTHATLMLLGFAGMAIVSRRFKKRIQKSIRAEEELEEHRDHLEELVKERTTELQEEIKERKQAEKALKENEEKYRDLYENAPVAYVSISTFDGSILGCNRAMENLMGYDRDNLLKMKIIDLIDESPQAQSVGHEIFKRFMVGESMQNVELQVKHKDGFKRWVSVSFEMVKDENGHVSESKSVAIDITNRKQAEKEKEKLEAKLQQAHKMESIGTLAGGIAHDFNNILSPIMIHSEMAMIGLPSDNPARHSLKEIYKAGERARDMVKQILTFSRKEEGTRVEIKIVPVLNEVIQMLRSSIPTTIEIQQNLKAEQATVLADPTQIHQIMLNLGTNAAHAMREKGGTLKVDLIREDLDSEDATKHPDLSPGSYLKLIVSDTGSGIGDETKQKIFEPYFTTKEPGEGTGMGLALIHGIVKSYDGDITVESELGKGTTFNVYLPRVEADVSPIEEPSVQIPRGTERILFVDDEKSAIDAIQPMLEILGYKVTARTSSIEALEAFRSNPQSFDLVITDMTMPNMTGKDLAKKLMSIRADIPIILCTGFSEQIDENKAKELGISAYAMKPIAMREMANTIREVFDKKQ